MNISNKNQLETYVARLRSKHSPERLGEGFVDRSLDEDFKYIGFLVLGRDAPDHILAWTGFETAIESKYLGRV